MTNAIPETIPYFEDKKDPVVPGKPTVERNMVQVVLLNRKTNSILCIQWYKFDWKTLIIGGIEDSEDVLTASRREITEETGYTDVRFVTELGKTRAAFYAGNKRVNRIANTTGLLFELETENKIAISDKETAEHFTKWVPVDEAIDFLNIEPQQYIWKKALGFIKTL